MYFKYRIDTQYKMYILFTSKRYEMKRKFTILTLIVALVFTMTMPSFAATSALQVVGKGLKTMQNLTGVSYCALGDSISAGCRNLYYSNEENPTDEEFNAFMQMDEKGLGSDSCKKITDPYAVSFSCVARIAKKINASSTKSMNGAFVALRAKDVCRILGLVDESAFEGDNWHNSIVRNQAKALFEDPVNKKLYKQGIAKADIITVELGENDMSALLINKGDEIVKLIVGTITGTIKDATEAAKLAGDFKTEFKELQDAIKAREGVQEAAQDVLRVLGEAADLGVDFSKMAIEGLKFYKEMLQDSQKYFNMLMKYIDKHKKPGAIVVVGSLINVFDTLDTAYIAGLLDKGDDIATGTMVEVLLDLMGVFITPYVNIMNSYIYSNAQKSTYNIFTHKTTKVRKYYVADLRAVDLNPSEDADGTQYQFHPNAHGQQMIADAFLEQIYKAQAEKGSKVADTKAKVTSVKNVVTTTVATVKKVQKFIDNVKDLAERISKGGLDFSKLGDLM